MKKWVSGLVALIMVLGLAVGANAAAAPESSGYRVVLSASGASKVGLATRGKLLDGKVSAQATEAQLAALDRLGIAYERVPERSVQGQAQPQGKPQASRPVPATQVPYGVKMIYGDPSLASSGVSGGAGVTVAVLDTGSVTHPDFVRADGSSIITDCVDFSSPKSDLIQGSCKDGHGHGTHVTGTIAAAGGADGKGIFGVAPGVSVLSYKVLSDRGSGYADDIARAIAYAADHGANIISMSLGSATPSTVEQDAINYAVSKGVLVIAAAGNSGPSADTIGYPAAYANVVAVASLNSNEVVSYYSSRGITDGKDNSIAEKEVEVAAPGRDVLSTSNAGGYATMSGTSMATPHITGLAAKMWKGSASTTRSWLQQAARQHDITQAEQVNNAGVGYDIASGYGLPQVKALKSSLWND